MGNAERGNVGKIGNGVVQKGDAGAEDAAEDFRHNQTKSGGHGPAKNRGAKRWVSVAGMAVARGLRMTDVIMVVGMRGHPPYYTRTITTVQHFPLYICEKYHTFHSVYMT